MKAECRFYCSKQGRQGQCLWTLVAHQLSKKSSGLTRNFLRSEELTSSATRSSTDFVERVILCTAIKKLKEQNAQVPLISRQRTCTRYYDRRSHITNKNLARRWARQAVGVI